jgi:1-acyl-sn-glycerol-3-phosphate acyltransferase
MTGPRGDNPAPVGNSALIDTPPWSRATETRDAIGNPWLATYRLTTYALLTLGLLPFQLIALGTWPALARAIPRAHHRLAARIIGLRVRCIGQPSAAPSTLFVSNHVSYFDIIALGSIVPACFVAKADVARWPIFGFLAQVCRTLFIDRQASDPRGQIDTIRRRLDTAESLVVFPEGTSSDGSRVLPFKSTLFAAVEREPVVVQPISIRYTRLNGIPIGRAYRPFYAWFGDMDLAPHLWSALSLGAAEVVIRFHEPTKASDFPNRKALAEHCHRRITQGVGTELP